MKPVCPLSNIIICSFPQRRILIFQTLSSPSADLSPGLAALTLGCDSGNLGSLSRVQLLLLDRLEPETLLSPFSLEEDWSDLRMQYDPGSTSAGIDLNEEDALTDLEEYV